MAATQPRNGALASLDDADVWLNSEPLTAEALRGRVVLVDFWTYSCVNWLRTLPYVRAWHERYRDRGLVVVGVHAPEFGFEHDLANVRRAVADLGVGYPVVIDNDFAIWRAFGNHYWPAVYLLDGDGRVRYHHFGEEAYAETERAIQTLLGIDEDSCGSTPAAPPSRPTGTRSARRDLRGLRPRRAPQRRARRRSRSTSGRSPATWSSSEESDVRDRPAGRSRTASRRATSTSSSAPARRPGPLRRAPRRRAAGRGPRPRRGRHRRGHARRAADVPARPPARSRSPSATFELTFRDPGARAYVFTFG